MVIGTCFGTGRPRCVLNFGSGRRATDCCNLSYLTTIFEPLCCLISLAIIVQAQSLRNAQKEQQKNKWHCFTASALLCISVTCRTRLCSLGTSTATICTFSRSTIDWQPIKPYTHSVLLLLQAQHAGDSSPSQPLIIQTSFADVRTDSFMAYTEKRYYRCKWNRRHG